MALPLNETLFNVCIPTSVPVHVYIPTSVPVHVCIPTSVPVHVCIPTSVPVHVCIPTSVPVHVCVYLPVYLYMCVYLPCSVAVYVYIISTCSEGCVLLHLIIFCMICCFIVSEHVHKLEDHILVGDKQNNFSNSFPTCYHNID